MSIWNDCDQHHAFPLYGYAVIPSFEDGVFLIDFKTIPDDLLSVAHEYATDLGIDHSNVSVDGNIVQIKISNEKLGYILYTVLMS